MLDFSFCFFYSCASAPSHISNKPTTRNKMASSMVVPYESWGTRRKRIPHRRMQRPMLTSLPRRCSKDPWVKSFWQVSQEEACRCFQQRHCRQAGHLVPGIEQFGASQLSSTISPFQKICCFSNQSYYAYPTQSIAQVKVLQFIDTRYADGRNQYLSCPQDPLCYNISQSYSQG